MACGFIMQGLDCCWCWCWIASLNYPLHHMLRGWLLCMLWRKEQQGYCSQDSCSLNDGTVCMGRSNNVSLTMLLSYVAVNIEFVE
jgi:hypothetical protein